MKELIKFIARRMKRAQLNMNEKDEDGDEQGMLWSKCEFETLEMVLSFISSSANADDKQLALKALEEWR